MSDESKFDYSCLPPNDTTIVSFSGGKDSLATWLEVRDHFERIIPFYLYLIPDLEFIEDNLQYYERRIGCHIIRLPQPKSYDIIDGLLYQPPNEERHALMKSWALPHFDHTDVHKEVCECAGVDWEKTYTAIGLKYADSIQRRTSLAKNGLVTHSRQKYYPIAHYTKDDVLRKIAGAGWKLPSDYGYFKDSFDGLQVRYLLPIKKHFPRDFAKICELFPLVELELYRYERSLR